MRFHTKIWKFIRACKKSNKIKIVFIAEISFLFGFTLTLSKEKSFRWKTIIFVCFSDQNGWSAFPILLFVSLVLCQFEKFWAQKGVQLTKKGSLSPLWRHGVQYETIELLRDGMSARNWRTHKCSFHWIGQRLNTIE